MRRYNEELDYGSMKTTFERFKQKAVKNYLVDFSSALDMNHVEASLLEKVAMLYLDFFTQLKSYCTMHSNFIDDGVRAFDREIQFYLAYLEYAAPLKRAGLSFCYADISDTSKRIYGL